MEQQLHTWLRVCLFFGVYVDATQSTTKEYTVAGATVCWTAKHAPNRAYYLQRCYNGFLCFSISVICVASIYLHKYPADFTLNYIATTILFVTRFIANALILMEAVWKQQPHAAFLVSLQDIEVAMRLRLKWDARSAMLLKQLQRFLIYQLALTLLGICPYMLSSSLFLDYGGYFWQGLWFICTMRVRTLQLLVYMQILRHYLLGLCEKLQQIVAYRMAPSRQLLDVDCGRLGTLVYFLAVREIYTQLYKAFELLNDFAGWSLYGIIISYILDLSSNFYWLLQGFDHSHSHRYFYWADLWWFIPLAAMVWHLCYFCDNCKRLCCTVAHLLSKIICVRSSSSMAYYRLVLHQFSMQVQLQPIEVSAKSFFVLDRRFIMSICAAMAMHLVILIQF